jgi:hypothetical protein
MSPLCEPTSLEQRRPNRSNVVWRALDERFLN